MKVFICTDHDGYWPVGTATVIVARNEDDAHALMTGALAARGLNWEKGFTLQKLDTKKVSIHVLCDGNY